MSKEVRENVKCFTWSCILVFCYLSILIFCIGIMNLSFQVEALESQTEKQIRNREISLARIEILNERMDSLNKAVETYSKHKHNYSTGLPFLVGK